METYYATAPALVAAIARRADARQILLRSYLFDIVPCAIMARLGCNRWALVHDRAMMRRLTKLV